MWDQEGLHPSFFHPVSDTLFLVGGTFLRSSSLWRGFLGATWGAGQEAGDTDEGLWRASHKMWASRTPAHWGWHRVSWCRGLLSATGYLLGSLSLFEYRQSFLVLEGRKEDQKYLKGWDSPVAQAGFCWALSGFLVALGRERRSSDSSHTISVKDARADRVVGHSESLGQ